MEKYAHKNDRMQLQTIKDHLEETAQLAEQNAVDLFKPIAHAIGLAHDIGKYADAFQDRINGAAVKFEHSACGAIEIRKQMGSNPFAPMMEFCIACHHTGLQDGGSGALEGTLSHRISPMREAEYTDQWDYSAYQDEISLEIPDFTKIQQLFRGLKNRSDYIELYAFFTRYLFFLSCRCGFSWNRKILQTRGQTWAQSGFSGGKRTS